MTSPSNDHLPPDPHEGIDAADNPDARAFEQQQTPAISRAANGGAPPTDAPPSGEAPRVEGTGAGDPLAGVRIDDDEPTVDADQGPEHPGVRRSS